MWVWRGKQIYKIHRTKRESMYIHKVQHIRYALFETQRGRHAWTISLNRVGVWGCGIRVEGGWKGSRGKAWPGQALNRPRLIEWNDLLRSQHTCRFIGWWQSCKWRQGNHHHCGQTKPALHLLGNQTLDRVNPWQCGHETQSAMVVSNQLSCALILVGTVMTGHLECDAHHQCLGHLYLVGLDWGRFTRQCEKWTSPINTFSVGGVLMLTSTSFSCPRLSSVACWGVSRIYTCLLDVHIFIKAGHIILFLIHG